MSSDASKVTLDRFASHGFRRLEDSHHFDALINSSIPIEIEVGSGKGMFLKNAAKNQPSTQFVGLEIASKYAALANSRLKRDNLDNAVCLCADAVRVMNTAVPIARLEAVHVYFPDPWWKARHKKRRVLNESMILAIDRALKPGSKLHFWTDVLDYYESTVELIAELTSWSGPHLIDERPPEDSMDYLTHFERRTRLNEMPVYRSFYSKLAQ